MLNVLVAELGEDDGDGEHGEAGVVLEPVTLVASCQATGKVTVVRVHTNKVSFC